MSFERWWKKNTSVDVPLYGEANAKKAWDAQQVKIDAQQRLINKLKGKLLFVEQEYHKTWDVLRTYNPPAGELEYIGFDDVAEEGLTLTDVMEKLFREAPNGPSK